MADYENLLVDRVGTDERVGRIALNRPEKMNALSQELLYELNDALHAMEADDSIRSIIVRGMGRTFSAGYDLTPQRRQRCGRRGTPSPGRWTTRAADSSWASARECSRLQTSICTSGTWPRSPSPKFTATPSLAAANWP